jgi:hypothetical protein
MKVFRVFGVSAAIRARVGHRELDACTGGYDPLLVTARSI